MDPLWLSLIAIVVVITGVLIVRLHPFLALTFGALLVAVFTPASRLQDSAIRAQSVQVTSIEDGQLRAEAEWIPGRHLVHRPSRATGWLEPVGEVELSPVDTNPSHARIEASSSVKIESRDWLLHGSKMSSVAAAATLTAGQRIAAGFGETCRKIGILIAMASVIGMCLLESGAARRIVDSTRNLVGENRTPVAFAISGFVVGIPVFFDTVFYLLVPLAKAMRVKTGRNYLLYVMSIVVGATMAHSLVPPTPGPLLVAAEIDGVEVGHMILGGLVVGLIAVTAGFLFAVWANRVWEIPLRDTELAGAEAAVENAEAARQRAGTPPSLIVSLLPILLPVVLLAGKTVNDSFRDAAPSWLIGMTPAIDFLGDKNIALVIAAVIALLTLAWQRRKASIKDWFAGVQQALASGGVIILITSAGGAFGAALRECGIAASIQGRFPATEDGIVLLFLAFVVTAVIRFAQGSATVAMITGVSIVGPLAGTMELGFHPVYLALAIGCGSKPLPWMNDSGFWIVGRMSGMTEAETLKIYSTTLTLMGFVGLVVTVAGASWLPLTGP